MLNYNYIKNQIKQREKNEIYQNIIFISFVTNLRLPLVVNRCEVRLIFDFSFLSFPFFFSFYLYFFN